jgi:hypothetical protein
LVLVFWAILLASTLAFSTPRQNNSDVELEIRAGFNGYFRPGKWTPLEITVHNGNRALNGTLRVRSLGRNNNAATLYQIPFATGPNNTESVTINISMETDSSEIIVELLDSNGLIIEESKELINIVAHDILYAVVTNTRTIGNIDMSILGDLGIGSAYRVDWTADKIPRDANVLRSVDVITILSDVGINGLSDEQQKALELWVTGGGHLIVHGGASSVVYDEGYLDELLPITIDGIETVESFEAIGTYIGHPSEVLISGEDEDYVITQNTPNANTQVLLSIAGEPVVVREMVGAGIVDFIGVDPIAEPLIDYVDIDHLWFELVASAPVRPSWGYDFEDWTVANQAIRIVTGFDLPSALQMLGFLSVYIILIGPANYIVLRQIGRRELAWFTIPIFIFAFTIIAYLTGFSLRGNAATVNHLSVVQVWPDSDIARVDGLVGVFSPRRTTYDLWVEGDMSLRTIPDATETDSAIAQIPIIQDGNYLDVDNPAYRPAYRVEELPVDAGIIASFATSGYIPAPHINGDATWHLGELSRITLIGSFTNSTEFALEDTVILVKDGYQGLGTIESGDTAEFSIGVDSYEPTWLPLGNRRESNNRNQIQSFHGGYNTSTRGAILNIDPYSCSAGSYNATTAQVMIEQEYDCTKTNGTDSERAARRRALLVTAINNEFDFSGGRAGDVYVIGWSDEASFTADLGDRAQVDQHETLYIFKLPVSFEIASNAEEPVIPSGLLTWTIVDSTPYNQNYTPYGLRVRPNEPVTFRFMPVAGLELAVIDQIDLNTNISGNARRVNFEFWNWNTGEWDLLEFETIDQTNNNNTLIIDEPGPYLGPNNAFLVRVELNETINTDSYVEMETLEPYLHLRQVP